MTVVFADFGDGDDDPSAAAALCRKLGLAPGSDPIVTLAGHAKRSGWKFGRASEHAAYKHIDHPIGISRDEVRERIRARLASIAKEKPVTKRLVPGLRHGGSVDQRARQGDG